MRVVISLVVLAASLGIWFGLRFCSLTVSGPLVGTGLMSGLIQGAAGVGGLVLVVYYLSVSASALVLRSTMILCLLCIGAFSLAVAAYNGLVTSEVLLRGGLLALPLVLGNLLGNHRFLATSPQSFRRFALILLMTLSLLGLGRAVFA